jgi:regulator of nucleoside diphosphate kinase
MPGPPENRLASPSRANATSKPLVYVAEADHERLWNLARSTDTLGASLLGEELDRAIVIGEDDAPRGFVRLGSRVEYRDLASGRTRTVQIVAPDQADIDANRLSVVTPVGAAVLGLRAGDAFSWTAGDGRPRDLVIVSVSDDPQLP